MWRIRAVLLAIVAAVPLAACERPQADGTPSAAQGDLFSAARQAMVREQLAGRDITDARVLGAMSVVPRHLFVPASQRELAYEDQPLPIGHGQTISQPYIVALMTQLARPRASDKALEVGTEYGYQAAVLSKVVAKVFSIELLEPLASSAAARLKDLGYETVTVRAGDGYLGWPEEAPFDVILVTAAPESIPQALVDQLKPLGRMVVPVGPVYSVQELIVLEKDADGRVARKAIAPVRFVPMRRPQ